MAITTENLKELIGESELSEDTLLKIKVMVENAIAEKVQAATEELKTAHETQVAELNARIAEATESHEAEITDLTEKANQYAQYVVQEITDKIDSYAEYVVEKFIEDNKQTLVESDEYARMKNVFESIKGAFEGAYFQLTPTDKTVELEGKLQEAKDSFNELFGKYQTLIKENEEMQYAMIFESLTKDLADTQKEKLKTLVENVSFDGPAEFKRGVELMIGQVTESSKSATDGGNNATATTIVEDAAQAEGATEVKPEASDAMKRYLKVL